jgi:hypothetical protein
MLGGIVSFSTNACMKSKLYLNIIFRLLILQMQVNNKKHNARGASLGVPVTIN